jgi:NAD(P)-dependent dehydrogenase (short-subunit alcohol dehydrogenase family)
MQPEKRLLDKVAIVSGGASGIGAETVRAFAMHGAVVVPCDVQDDPGHGVTKEVTDAGGVGGLTAS